MIRPKIETTTQLTVAPNPVDRRPGGHADRDRHHRAGRHADRHRHLLHRRPGAAARAAHRAERSRPGDLVDEAGRRDPYHHGNLQRQFHLRRQRLECRLAGRRAGAGRRTDRRPPGPIRVPFPAHDAGLDLRQARSTRPAPGTRSITRSPTPRVTPSALPRSSMTRRHLR